MKKFAKFIPVALGLLTLASCSNDEFFGDEAQNAVKLENGDMLVTFAEPQEDGSAFTRGYTSRDMKQRRWWSGIDKLTVYGSQFGAYDVYMFKQNVAATTGKFVLVSNPSYVDKPRWALFPENQIHDGKWTKTGGLDNSESTVDVDLPQVITYDAAYDAANYANDDQPYYMDNLPRWGEVESVEGGYVQTKLNWMTGILRLQLAGTPKYAKGVRVQLREAGDPSKTLAINGTFKATIAHNDVMVPNGAAKIEANPHNGDYATNADIASTDALDGLDHPGEANRDGAIYVYFDPEVRKLIGNENSKSVIYLPLPVWDKQVDIVVSVSSDYDGGADGCIGNTASTDFGKYCTWTEYKTFKNKRIELGKVYGNKNEYNLALDGTNPEAISDALELMEGDGTLTLTANNPIMVCKGDNFTTIEIPNKDNVQNIIIDLRAGLDGCTGDETLNIVYKNSQQKFKGNVTLITPDHDGTNTVKLNVDLDESGFGIVQGKCLDVSAYGTIDIDAAEFVIGNEDKFTPTPAFPVNNVKFSKNVKSFVVAKEATINEFTIDQSDPSEDKWTHPAVETITINGTVDGLIDAYSKVKSTFATNIKIEGVEATAGSHAGPSVTGDISTRGTVTINAGSQPLNNLSTLGGAIFAEKAISATGFATITGTVQSAFETVSLSGFVTAGDAVTAKKDITIIEQAKVTGDIESEEGSITINNAYDPTAVTYGGDITAEKGIVSLNEVGTLVTTFSGDITANEFAMTGLTTVQGDVIAHGTATIDVDAQGGNCIAVSSTLTLDNPTANTLNLKQGYVSSLVNLATVNTSLTFSDDPAYAALATVANPDKLIPTNVSKWNGDWEMKGFTNFESDGYNIEDTRVWTATQLGYQNKTATATIDLQSNIDLMNESWPGITETAETTVNGNYKTISKVNLKGAKATKTAGFYNTCAEKLVINSLTFDGVQTNIVSISGGKYDGGIGAVAGRLVKGAELTRVIVKLAGKNFGTLPTKNAQTANVGGLIGSAGWATLTGCQVDATGVALTGYKCMGGYIGRSYSEVNIKMAEEDGDDPEVLPTVTGLSFYVTYDATKDLGGEKNDPYQGSTGWFIGSINLEKDVTIGDIDVEKELKRPIAQAEGSKANEKVASLIESVYSHFWFMRDEANADQTLIGNSGFDITTVGTFTIQGKEFEIFKTGSSFTVGSPKLYSLIKDAYVY